MKRFGSIITLLTTAAFAVAMWFMGFADIFMSYVGGLFTEANDPQTLLFAALLVLFVGSGALTALFALIGMFTKKGGLVATCVFASIMMISGIAFFALYYFLVGFTGREETIIYAIIGGSGIVIFLFSLFSDPKLSKKEGKQGKKAGQDVRFYPVDPSEREVYSEEDRLNMAAYGSLGDDSTPRTTTRSGYYTVNNYSGSSYSYGKKQKHKKGRCTDAELFNRFNKVLVSNGYIDSLGGRGGFPF